MINERILNEFRQHNTTPEYIMLITDIRNGEVVCNEESLIISGKQIFTSLDSYLNGIKKVLKEHNIDPLEMEEYFDSLPSEDKQTIENYLKAITDYLVNEKEFKVIDKELTVFSNVILDDNDLYYGQLNGYISKEKINELESNKSKTESSHYIEVVDTVLQKTIDITFNRAYKQLPKIYITIDEKFEYLYRNYSISPVNNEEGEYIGVQITFNNLKNTNTYPPIGVVIIGDEKTEEYDDEGDIKPIYHNLTVNLYYEKIDENGVIIEVPIENIPILINDKEFTPDNCGSVTARLPEGEYEVRIGESNFKYTPEIVNLDSDKTIGLKIHSLITATFSTLNHTIRLNGGWDGVIDWGDGDIEIISNTSPIHNYVDSEETHTIRIKTLNFKEAFKGITNLVSIDIPLYSIGSLSEKVFEGCNSLESITISENIEALGENCFAGCSKLESITLPNSLLRIEQFCFSSCTSLESIILPENLIELGESSFVGCTSLASINLPDKLETIGKDCFFNNSDLMEINIPKSVSFLGKAFCATSTIRDTNVILNWTDDDIIEYSTDIWNYSRPKFIIPKETMNNYILKEYPQDKLRESE